MTSLLNQNPHEVKTSTELLLTAQTYQSLVRIFSLLGFGKKEKQVLEKSLLFMGFLSLLWLILRSGTKPTRIVYPCQQKAVNTISLSLNALIPLSLTSLVPIIRMPSITAISQKIKHFLSKHWKLLLAILIIVPSLGFVGFFLWNNQPPSQPPSNGDGIHLVLEPNIATSFPASDIYVVNGRAAAHISNLINLMGANGLNFYQSSATGTNQGPTGLIANDDVILIKINEQWDCRGGTNTDVLRELIQAIIDHPDGFDGEIVVADNGQGLGSLDWDNNNAEDHSQSTQDVVSMFSNLHPVSAFDWQLIRGVRVSEYSNGDQSNGYILNETADAETGICVSYPKFQTRYGTRISFKYGIWNGITYENRLKIINIPVLKSHSRYGVTASLKHYMGVQSEGRAISGGLANGHQSVATGGMGTLFAETRFPVLNIIDAIWVNANPYPSFDCGPQTSYAEGTNVNVLLASTDPVALDYWAARHVLMQTASLIGYEDCHTMDPDNTHRDWGLEEAFGTWLNHTKNELLREGYTVTTNQECMNVYISSTSAVLLSNTFSFDGVTFLTGTISKPEDKHH